ncbi:hypothetical protein H0H92_009530 [Tricholoma furcatifolium]|nr:hypothetical protein H0H92_009530 [Tricholoma furcatifolium]
MHRCLQIPEILNSIFSQIIDTKPTEDRWVQFPGSIALVNIALTCRSFKEPALNVLWRSILGLDPILRCLPSDAVNIIEEAKDIPVAWRTGTRGLRFNRNLGFEDYSRIRENASRVRVVHRPRPGAFRPYALDKLFLHILYSRQPVVGPILPHVQHAALYATDFENHALYPRLIIGSRLSSIDLILFGKLKARAIDGVEHSPDIPWKTIGRVLTEASCTIHSFKVDEYRSEDQWQLKTYASPHFTSLLCSFHSLKVLEALSFDVDYSTLLRFSALSSLAELTISLSSATITQVVEHHMHCDQLFPSLRKLHLNTPCVEPCTRLLKLPHAFERLASLEIYSDSTGSRDVRHLFQSIRNSAALSKNLSSLKVKIAFLPWEPPCNVHPLDFATLTPLLSLPNLTTLHLETDSPVHLTNADLAKIGAAWHRLEVLNFPERTSRSTPSVTLTGLLPLLSACPHLQELTLRIDATEDVSSFADLGAIVPHRSLTDFCYCRSPINDPDGVAAFLALTFSGLETMGDNWLYGLDGELTGFPEDPVDQRHRVLWNEVEKRLSQVLLHPNN